MIGGVLSHGTSQLSHLDLTLIVPLEAGVEDLSLAGLQTWGGVDKKFISLLQSLFAQLQCPHTKTDHLVRAQRMGGGGIECAVFRGQGGI